MHKECLKYLMPEVQRGDGSVNCSRYGGQSSSNTTRANLLKPKNRNMQIRLEIEIIQNIKQFESVNVAIIL